ncbi:MAG: hypothetical protein ACRC28_17385 [Clostridium sp.]|uniref:hypothetical protein n=1 Tax=Clostridium sp. TaxID=1506 RepID=UPI003F32BEA8
MEIVVTVGLIALILFLLIRSNIKTLREATNKKNAKPFTMVSEWTKIKTTRIRISKVIFDRENSKYNFYLEMENIGRVPFEYNPVDFYFVGKNGIIKIDTYDEKPYSTVKGVKTLLKGDKYNTTLEFKVKEKDKLDRLIYTDFFIKREFKIRKKDIV